MNPVIQLIDNILAGIGNFGDRIILLWEREPVVITGLVTAVLDGAVVFGAPIDDGQKQAVIGIVTALGIVLARSKVTPV